MHGMSEEAWELAALERLAETDVWEPKAGHDIAPGSGLRDSWADPVIRPWVMDALIRLNPDVPPHHLQQALADILSTTSQDAITENHRMHGILIGGYSGLSYVDDEGVQRSPTVHVISANPDRNDWLAANQVRLVDRDHDRRFDVVLYCNGLPGWKQSTARRSPRSTTSRHGMLTTTGGRSNRARGNRTAAPRPA